MKQCHDCGADLLAKAKFCKAGGTKVSVNHNEDCAQCGSAYKPDDLFCTYCGAELKKVRPKSASKAKSKIRKSGPNKKRKKTAPAVQIRRKKGISTFVKILAIAGVIY